MQYGETQLINLRYGPSNQVNSRISPRMGISIQFYEHRAIFFADCSIKSYFVDSGSIGQTILNDPEAWKLSSIPPARLSDFRR